MVYSSKLQNLYFKKKRIKDILRSTKSLSSKRYGAENDVTTYIMYIFMYIYKQADIYGCP